MAIKWSVALAAVTLLAAALLSSGETLAQTGSCVPAVPCVDGNGDICPDLIIDREFLQTGWYVENRRFSKRNCSVLEGEVVAGVRTLLRFWSTTPNLGPGQLFLGDPNQHPEWFDPETCHRHPHLKEYTDYRLWKPEGYQAWIALRQQAGAGGSPTCARDLLAANPAIASQMVAGHKQGFCVVDLFPHQKAPCPTTSTLPDQYVSCDYQGLSVCWADAYDPGLPGQWIDVTDLPDGEYVLELEVNAEHFFEEAVYTNNSEAVTIQLVKPVRRGGR